MAEPITYLLHSINTWEAHDKVSAVNNQLNIHKRSIKRDKILDRNVDTGNNMDLVSTFINNSHFETNIAEESSFLEEEKPDIVDLPNNLNIRDPTMFDVAMPSANLSADVDATVNESLARLPGNSGSLTCNVCSKEMNTKAHLVRHLKTHLNKNSKEFECSLCGNVYAHKYNLKRHLIKAHNFQPEDISSSLLGEKNAPVVEPEGFSGVAPLPALDKDDDKSELYATYVGGNGIFDARAANIVTNFQTNTFTPEFTGPYNNFSEFNRDNELVLPVANAKPPDIHLLNAAPQIPFEFQSYMQQYAANTAAVAAAAANNAVNNAAGAAAAAAVTGTNGNNNHNNNGSNINNNNNNNNNGANAQKRVNNVIKKEEEKPRCHVCDKELSTKWSLMRHLTKVHKLESKYGENGPSPAMKENHLDIKFENELDTDQDSRGEFDTDDHSEPSLDSTFNQSDTLIENKFNRSEHALVAPMTPEAGTPIANFNNGSIGNPMLAQEPVNNLNKIDLNSFGGFPGLTAEEYNYLTTGLGSAQELLLNGGQISAEPMEFAHRNMNNDQSLLDSVLNGNYPNESKTSGDNNEGNKKMHECHICGATLSNRSNLKGHLKRHTYGPVQECNVCNMKCADKTSLRQHIKSVHKMWNENGNTSA